jgi:hypothetical protein
VKTSFCAGVVSYNSSSTGGSIGTGYGGESYPMAPLATPGDII